MDIEILSIGLATAQGSAAEILAGKYLEAPRGVPWPLRPGISCRLSHPARGVADQLAGPDRWRLLARSALQECLPEPVHPRPPLVVASCNGATHSVDAAEWISAFDTRRLLAGTLWADQRLPVVSGSCASGLQALFLAAQLLTAGHDEVVVLALDILSPASHENFEALRILAADPVIPWHPTSVGFIPGEAAVALRARRARGAEHRVVTGEPVLRQDLDRGDGLGGVVAAFRSQPHSVIVGQGTGPAAVDAIELAVLDTMIDRATPVTTPHLHFGHTLGASGLLSLGLAALALRLGELPLALKMPAGSRRNARPLAAGSGGPPLESALVVCRALSGACAATRIAGSRGPAFAAPPFAYRSAPPDEPAGHVVLRRIIAEAARVRPVVPPDLLLVCAAAPLVPSPTGSIGSRLLPHAVLEITPGSIPSLIARRWGYSGPALCLVGEPGSGTDVGGEALVQACRAAGRTVAQVRLHGTEYERDLEWDV